MLRSPRKRGCFRDAARPRHAGMPIPAQAGVFPWSDFSLTLSLTDPRASGGVSINITAYSLKPYRSPRKRGCFRRGRLRRSARRPIPAQAGVFPDACSPARSEGTDPRASGGVSVAKSYADAAKARSPRKRGCFYPALLRTPLLSPIPAQAGVFLFELSRADSNCPDPRASGGVSGVPFSDLGAADRSPRKRGCFLWVDNPRQWAFPIPAQAGVFPSLIDTSRSSTTDPRASGGVSMDTKEVTRMRCRSPRKRGCFQCISIVHEGEAPIPARAGVFLRSFRVLLNN